MEAQFTIKDVNGEIIESRWEELTVGEVDYICRTATELDGYIRITTANNTLIYLSGARIHSVFVETRG
jgi:hypothetical protein